MILGYIISQEHQLVLPVIVGRHSTKGHKMLFLLFGPLMRRSILAPVSFNNALLSVERRPFSIWKYCTRGIRDGAGAI